MKNALKARANRLYGGNLSAVIEDLGREAEKAEAVARLIARAGGSTLTDARRREIDGDLEGARGGGAPAKNANKRAKNRAA